MLILVQLEEIHSWLLPQMLKCFPKGDHVLFHQNWIFMNMSYVENSATSADAWLNWTLLLPSRTISLQFHYNPREVRFSFFRSHMRKQRLTGIKSPAQIKQRQAKSWVIIVLISLSPMFIFSVFFCLFVKAIAIFAYPYTQCNSKSWEISKTTNILWFHQIFKTV